MKYGKYALAIALMGVSSMAAADSWFYAGGSVGQSSFKSDKTSTFGFHVGTGILPIIGVEAGYWKLGSFDVGPETYDFQSFYAGIKPSIDLGPVHLYGRLGAHRYDLSGKAGAQDDDGYDLMYGVGVEYFVIDMISVGAGYQNFEVSGGNVDSYTLNATFHFL
ncbi:porin family protein [Vibrio sp. B1Z05]|uniref:porin family protein n=1 Tax=Vibrio sp. B1Z05 TaxID=2654980 RepID=UPI00128E5FBA|nr:porin family protein [Vibrio sp. B1Z05]MPW35695.1 outer membrane beta-barrel protein [Vibrio sp. B1Z05]